MAFDSDARLPPLEHFFDYLLREAKRMLSQHRLQGKLDPDDIVQQTLMEAHDKAHQKRCKSEGEMKAWLRTMLERNLLDAIRKLNTHKRDVSREQSIDAANDSSAIGIKDQLTADQSTPSQRAMKNEELAQLEEAIANLSPDQAEVVRLHILQELPLAEVARQLNRTEAAVAGLYRRALENLRKLMPNLR